MMYTCREILITAIASIGRFQIILLEVEPKVIGADHESGPYGLMFTYQYNHPS